MKVLVGETMNNKYITFWDWFLDKEEYIFSNIESSPNELAVLIQAQLSKVNENLLFEIPFLLVNDKRDFIISADGVESLFEEVVNLTNHAPTFKHWNIIPFRPRTYQIDQVVEMDGIYLSYEDIYFQYELTDLPIDINVYIKGYDGEDNRYIHAYFILLDTLIGEYDAVTLINETYVYPYEENQDLLNITEIVTIIDELNKSN